MKKKLFVAFLVICMVGSMSGGIAYAAFSTEKETTNVVNMGNVNINIVDIYTRNDDVKPGDTVLKNVYVKNTGKYDAYVRLKADKVWTENGDKRDDLDASQIILNFSNPKDWIDGGDGYYYYQKMLAPGEETSHFIDSFTIPSNIDSSKYLGKEGNIIVSAEAVQYKYFEPEKDANANINSWGSITIKRKEFKKEIDQTPSKEGESNGVTFAQGADEFVTVNGDDLFLNKSLLPGQETHQSINIDNKNQKAVSIYLYAKQTDVNKFSSVEEMEMSAKLIKAIKMTITATYPDGTKKTVYSGPVYGVGEGADMTKPGAIFLGKFATDESAVLDVKLDVPSDWDTGNVKGMIDWIFTCVSDEDKVATPTPIPTPTPLQVTSERDFKMRNGTYRVAFQTPLGHGAGVVVLHDGHVRGGDSSLCYLGTYEIDGASFRSVIHAFKHTTILGMSSVFGVDDVNITLIGTYDGDNGSLRGSAPEAPGVSFSATLNRLGD